MLKHIYSSHVYANNITFQCQTMCLMTRDATGSSANLCIGAHKQFNILQYATTLCQYIKFMVVDAERSLARPCQMTSRQFLREYILKAPLDCYLETDAPSCLVRLPTAMLLSQRSFNLQTVLFNRSNDVDNYTERIKFSIFFKCLYCCCFEKYYNAADHIQSV